MAYRKRGGPKGRKCIRRQRVRVRGHGMQLRCAKYGPKRSGSSKRKSSKRKSYRRRKPAGMARRGSTCKAFKYVKVRGYSKRQRRCRKYGR